MEPTRQPIRVLVVDDHPMMRDGICASIERQDDLVVVGEASDGQEGLALFRELRPDVTLMDIQMPVLGGIEALETIRAERPDAVVLILTTYPGDAQAHRALQAGAAGYLLKSCLRKDLIDTIRAVHARRRVISPDVAQELALHAPQERLSDREVAVLRLVADGQSNKQIAWALQLSLETVKSHLKTIFEKLAVDDRTHAVTVATRRGYLS
ncbi:response regulator transcription factor [Sphingomonas jatrophae]|uniref:Two component transcriptional regulator, LuxR family n=1 Tax=Sphingomonas jatrophae TaxID=1166337 RepID=A0A1I6L050_9SPHN|nr:response regulator transcription factor [Sphingomonas jatrophae]SFR96618.1 two component transcriptional regulator, LuxR family [Sphingomonas jatrophae]